MLCATSQDPVKYPEDMSPNFKSFLKGLLNKVVLCLPCLMICFDFHLDIEIGLQLCAKQVPQNRLTWPALLEHPFVKETSDELEARVMLLHNCYYFDSFIIIFITMMMIFKTRNFC